MGIMLIALWDVPWLGLGDSNDHTLEVVSENNLTTKTRVLVENTCTRVSLQNVLFIVGARWEPLKPFLSDADLALGGASVDIFEPVGGRVDEAAVGQGFQKSLPS
jgi:hypothetical protein